MVIYVINADSIPVGTVVGVVLGVVIIIALVIAGIVGIMLFIRRRRDVEEIKQL